MTEVFGLLIESSITMSVIVMLFLLISPLAAKRYLAKSQYYTWLIITIGFLIPFRFCPVLPAIALETPILADVPLPIINLAGTTGDDAAAVGTAMRSISIVSIISKVWLVGAIAFLMFHLNRHRRFLKLVKRWGENVQDVKIIAALDTVKARLAITQPVQLKVCEGIKSPMLIGLFKPSILLGTQYIPESQLPLILEHELVHFKRKDLWVKTLVLLTTSLHWFNPFVHLMAREMAAACELSCDAEVTKNVSMEGRGQYAESIIGIIRQQSSVQTSLCTNFYSGKQGMKKRVLSIMDKSSKKPGIFLPMFILLFTISTGAVFALERPQAQPAAPKQDEIVTQPFDNQEHAPQAKPPSPIVSAIITDENKMASAHKIKANNTYVYSSADHSSWDLKQGEGITLIIELNGENPTGQASIGYVLDGKMIELYKGKIENGVVVTSAAPQDGAYRFYINNAADASTDISIHSFAYVSENMLIEDKGFNIIEV